MNPLEFLILVVVTLLALIGLSQVPLIQDVITHSGFSAAEVWSGVGVIMIIFYTMLLALAVKFN